MDVGENEIFSIYIRELLLDYRTIGNDANYWKKKNPKQLYRFWKPQPHVQHFGIKWSKANTSIDFFKVAETRFKNGFVWFIICTSDDILSSTKQRVLRGRICVAFSLSEKTDSKMHFDSMCKSNKLHLPLHAEVTVLDLCLRPNPKMYLYNLLVIAHYICLNSEMITMRNNAVWDHGFIYIHSSSWPHWIQSLSHDYSAQNSYSP